MEDQPTGKAILKVNGHWLLAVYGWGFAYGFWLIAQEGFEVFLWFALAFAFGGLKWTVLALYGTVRLIWRMRLWARFQRKGVAPKADPAASTEDLRKKGLTR